VPRPHAQADPDAGLGIEGLREVRRFSHEAMATVFEVHALHGDDQYAAQAAQAAFDLVDRLEAELSRFRTNSDITRINHLAAGESTRVSPSTLECLVIARHMFDLSGGAFDVSIGTGLPSLDLDPDEVVVRATRAGVRVDLGGVGKGYAVDRMAELMDEWGVGVALVHGGFSSVLALEPPIGRDGWPLTLSDPRAPSLVLARLSARQMALGASGLRKGDHIVDPRTGEPVRGRLAAWAAVPRPGVARPEAPADGPRVAAAAVTDALTTAFMLISAEEIEELCERSPGLEAWILPDQAEGPHSEPELLHFGGSVD
jgi:thiamine biosynthesis lipoprotein